MPRIKWTYPFFHPLTQMFIYNPFLLPPLKSREVTNRNIADGFRHPTKCYPIGFSNVPYIPIIHIITYIIIYYFLLWSAI